MKAAVVQMTHGDDLAQNLERARLLLDEAHHAGAELALLPEYFFTTPTGGPDASAVHAPRLRRFYEDVSRETGMMVAGNLLERGPAGLVNMGVVADEGRILLEQPKVHPMPREAAAGVQAGARFDAATVRGIRMGMLVCADILYPEAARVLSLQGARILLNPVMSPWRPAQHDPTRAARESVFIARAYDNDAFVLKAGGFRRPVQGGTGVAGRSLVTAPWGTLARHTDDFAEEILVADLDMDALDRVRKRREGFPARRPEAYRDLVDG